MKKIYIVAMATFMIIAFSACDGIVDTNSYPLVQPTAEYEIDTWGSNSEIYEFTPKTDTTKTCVMAILDSGASMSLQCFTKGK